MCGILGFLDPPATQTPHSFAAALDQLAHRGPDDKGTFSDRYVLLGHRRLSIIDLSPTGHQPMIEPQSGAVIVFNGEIYNYIELRKELTALGRRFAGGSDTEVLLHAYLEWGSDCLKRLNGMWAFAIWLPAERKMFFARDRFGVKPFYYSERPGFAFASEPKALLGLLPGLREVDTATLAEFLALGNLYTSDSSFYRGVRTLPPAHCGEICAGDDAPRIWRYWDYPEQPAEALDDREALEQFSALFEDAVRLRHRSDVPVGITLSGGIDSTAVLAASVKTAGANQICFTSVYGSDGEGEAGWARKAAAPYGILPIEVPVTREEWLELLRRICWHLDGPGYSPAVFPLWAIMREARRTNVPVLLEGQGADEIFGGYPQYSALAVLAALKEIGKGSKSRGGIKAAARIFFGAAEIFSLRWIALWTLREAFPKLIELNRSRASAGSTLRESLRESLRMSLAHAERREPRSSRRYDDPVNERLLVDHSSRVLPGLLHYGDAISMAHGVETRLPFMDYRLVEWAFSQASGIKVGEGTTKRILRAYLGSVGQGSIANRKDKQGYPTPADKWLTENDGRLSREILLDANAAIRDYCDQERIDGLIKSAVSGRAGLGNHLYRLVTTELWLRECIENRATL